MIMELNGKNLIGSELSGEGKLFYGVNPSVGKQLDEGFFEATPAEIHAAIEKASRAFRDYRNKTGKEKAEFLEAIGDELIALGDALIKRCTAETGLPEARITGERGRTVNQLKLFAQLLREGSWVDARIDTADPERKPIAKPDVRSMLRPLGPVGIFGASNFPLAFSVAGGDTASALAAGCTVVFKAHQAHPGTSELVGHAILSAARKTGMPDGIFSLLQGASIEVGQAIVKDPLIKAIGFTGSFRGGKALFDEANKRSEPIPVFAEMGSVNPVFILPGALKNRGEQIARDLAASVTQGVGQFCTNPGLVLSEDSSAFEPFRTELRNVISASSSGVMLTQGIKSNFDRGVEKLKSVSGVVHLSTGKEVGEGYQATPSVFEAKAAVFLHDHILEEEVFGPSTILIKASDKSELLKAAEKLSGHLTATVHATEAELEEYSDLFSILEQKVGRVIINGYPTGVEVAHAMVHGGPFPATTNSQSTSVGTRAINRFSRPVCYQGFPDVLLPDELKSSNPLGIWRLFNGSWQKD
jgi:2,5-dioxopentanoate dehydrogenase